MPTRRLAKLVAAPRMRGVAILLAAVVVSLAAPSTATAQPGSRKLVVVVYPNESDGAPGTILVNHAIRSTFASHAPDPVDVRNEYVEISRLQEAEFAQAQVSLLRRKYAGRKIDLVIAGLSSGLDFVLKHRDELFPGVPVVFVAVDHREVKTRRLPPDVIGVPIRMDLTKTLELALRFHPGTRRVFVVAGGSAFDIEWGAEARRTFRPYEERLEFDYLIGLPMDELLTRVAQLPEHSIIYYLNIHSDGTGKPFIPADALERLATHARVPIYGHADTFVGRGIVGGHVFSFEAEGNNAARLALRILAGERPESIPSPEVSENTDMFDWRQLQRWGISEEVLPAGSVVRFKAPSFWSVYRWHILAGLLLCTIEALLITALLVQRVKRRRADERFRQVVETAPVGMILVGRDGTIVMANVQVEQLFGYAKAELLGESVEVLVPEPSRGQHAIDRVRFFATPAIRPAGGGRELLGRRKDGSEFPVEVGLSPLTISRGLFVLASIIDLTERRRSEDRIRANQRELQLLTGRLLEAQEVERRRIARELHDDLNQGLALLSVELDFLRQRPPASAGEMADHLRKLSARVKELSSSVHELSHQLHPSKLEQLGLVPAIRGLCKELAQHHGLEVEFLPDDVPAVLPEATALCLYRIVQEALRNVVKHGRTDRAVIELTGTSEGIVLRVSDNGAGFDPATRCNGGLGLVSMRERLHLIGGAITIDSRPGHGTRLHIRVPLPAGARSQSELQPAVAGT